MPFFFFALLVLLMGSLPWTAVFRPPNKPAWLMALYLLCSANAVLTLITASSFHLLNRQWVVLAGHMLLGGVGWLTWMRFGKPSLWGPFRGWKPKFNVQSLKREPLLALLALFVSLAYAFALAQIIYIPQNNVDSLSTHLSRIGFWRQLGSFLPWSTTMLTQVWYPVNAQLQTYWTLLFLGGDQLVGSVQWLAALVSAVGAHSMARFYGYNLRQSVFAALVFLSFPLIALQSTTTQTDLVTTVFFISAVYFLVCGLRDGQLSLLSLSAISIGLGVGVKKSYFLLLPVLAVLALLAALQYGRRSLKPLVFWSLNLMVGIVLFGSYTYVVNWRYYGD
ncbi:MAG TPA: glycosyltransferase family 39 protein, partial [Anaerolineales bacterium]